MNRITFGELHRETDSVCCDWPTIAQGVSRREWGCVQSCSCNCKQNLAGGGYNHGSGTLSITTRQGSENLLGALSTREEGEGGGRRSTRHGAQPPRSHRSNRRRGKSIHCFFRPIMTPYCSQSSHGCCLSATGYAGRGLRMCADEECSSVAECGGGGGISSSIRCVAAYIPAYPSKREPVGAFGGKNNKFSSGRKRRSRPGHDRFFFFFFTHCPSPNLRSLFLFCRQGVRSLFSFAALSLSHPSPPPHDPMSQAQGADLFFFFLLWA